MLILEDGTMPEGANTYASLELADAYLVRAGCGRRRRRIRGAASSQKRKLPSSVPLMP